MYRLLMRFWCWLNSNDMVRHCICVFFKGNDPVWEGDSAKVYEDMCRYIDYQNNPEDPKLREFGQKLDAERRLNRRILKVRVVFDFAVSILGITLLVCLLLWLNNAVEAVKEVFE